MSTFRVGFDGKWQGKFDTLDDAIEWAEEVASLTGRTTFVCERPGPLRRLQFRAAFPAERAEEAAKAWHTWRSNAAGGPAYGG